MLCELCPAECGLEDQCEDVLREAGAIPEPPELGTGLKSDQVCSEVTNNPSETNKSSQTDPASISSSVGKGFGCGGKYQEHSALLSGLQERGVLCDVRQWI